MRMVLIITCIAVLCAGYVRAGNSRELGLEEYIELACANDTEFERILIDGLTLKYQKTLRLPARDLILGVREQYVSFVGEGHHDAATTVGLEKLFPMTGTELEAGYDVYPNLIEDEIERASHLGFSLTQPIARNAFGRSTRLLDQIIGLEVDVARYQIVEAYEDYLATVIVAYYEWWAAWESVKIGQSSYRENERLLDNILEREKQKIALPVDVNKIRIQLLAKKEDMVVLEDALSNAYNVVERMIRYQGKEPLVPQENPPLPMSDVSFDEAYKQFRQDSRTFAMLDLLAKSSDLNVEREADDLLPSLDLIFEADIDGVDYGLNDADKRVFAGIALEWPIPNEQDRAEYDVAGIEAAKVRLTRENTHYRLYTNLKNLHLDVHRERRLSKLSAEKISLAAAVVVDETENYSFGNITLNDYISAVNVHDNNRFSRLAHDLQERILTVEWLRLTDQLVTRDEKNSYPVKAVPALQEYMP